MNLYHVFAVSFELYRLKFDINEARVRAYRVVDNMTEHTLKAAVKAFIYIWKS